MGYLVRAAGSDANLLLNVPPDRRGLISDAEALELFHRSSLVLLPYIDATQSALIAAAYYFQKPVLVSRSGALPEYVVDGQTGFIVEPGHPATLAWLGGVAGHRTISLGVEHFGQTGTIGDLYRQFGIDAEGIIDSVMSAAPVGR